MRLWIVIRLVVLLFVGDPLHLPGAVAIYVAVVAVAVAFLDTRRHRERAMLGNLGVSPVTVGALFAAPAILGEVAIRLGAALLA